jgi:hypothetical protein
MVILTQNKMVSLEHNKKIDLKAHILLRVLGKNSKWPYKLKINKIVFGNIHKGLLATLKLWRQLGFQNKISLQVDLHLQILILLNRMYRD